MAGGERNGGNKCKGVFIGYITREFAAKDLENFLFCGEEFRFVSDSIDRAADWWAFTPKPPQKTQFLRKRVGGKAASVGKVGELSLISS